MGIFTRWFGKKMGPGIGRCPEEMKCLELIRVMLDEESTKEDADYVMRHIDNCYKCYDNYDVEMAIRQVMKQKRQNLEVPESVIAEIRQKITIDK